MFNSEYLIRFIELRKYISDCLIVGWSFVCDGSANGVQCATSGEEKKKFNYSKVFVFVIKFLLNFNF